MTKMDVKKGLVTVGIAATASLVGCGGIDKKAEKDTQAQTQASTEAKTEDANSKKIKELEDKIKELSETNSDLQEKVSDLETKNAEEASANDAKEEKERIKEEKEEEYRKLAIEWYKENVDYFSEAGMAYNVEDENGEKHANIDKIVNVIKMLKGDYTTMNFKEADTAIDDINYMTISPELNDSINAINNNHTPEEKITIIPSYAEFIGDEDVREEYTNWYDLRNELIIDINDDGKITDEIKDKYEERFFDVEYNNTITDYQTLNQEYDNNIYAYILSKVYWSYAEDVKDLTQKNRIFTDNEKYGNTFEGGVKLGAENEKETYIIEAVANEGLNALNDEEKHIYVDFENDIPQKGYFKIFCQSREDILNNFEKINNDEKDNTQSKIDLLNQKKVLLQTLKTNKEYTSYITFEENTLTM